MLLGAVLGSVIVGQCAVQNLRQHSPIQLSHPHNQFELASYCMCFMLDYRKPVIKQLIAVANECFR